MRFVFSKELTVDSKVEPWKSEGIRIGFYSAPGTRKSYTVAACIIEPFLAEGGTVVIFEPRSEWHTLKQKYESVVVVGGPFKDIPLAVNYARVYAEAIVTHGISMVFDFSETEDEDLVKFAAELLARIYTLQNVTRRPLLLFLEELAEYCPFRTTGKLVPPWVYDRMKSRIIKIATQGRPLGFNLAFTSQRPAQLDYTVRMMANLSFYGKFHPKDLNDIKTVLKSFPIPIKETAEKCVNMPHGSWIAITAEGIKQLSITRKRTTPHGADTPTLEYEAPKTKQTQQTMRELTKVITDALEKQQLEETEVRKLRRELAKISEKLIAKDKKIEELNTALTVAGKITIEPQQKTEDVDKVRSDTIAKCKREHLMTLLSIRNTILEIFNNYPQLSTDDNQQQPTTSDVYKVWESKLPSLCARRILKFLLTRKPAKFTKSQLGVSLGYKTTSGTFNGAISFLKQNNLIKYDGKYLHFPTKGGE